MMFFNWFRKEKESMPVPDIEMERAEKHLHEFDSGHSDFQIEHFIIGSQGNLFFQYKQACREIAVRYEQVQNGNKTKTAKRELLKFIEMADALRSELKWDQLNSEHKKLLEQHAWYEKAKRMIAVDLICSRGQAVGKNTIDFILQLPFEFKKDLIKYVLDKDPRNLIEWAIKEH